MRRILLAITILTWFLPVFGQEPTVNFRFDTVCLGDTTRFISLCKPAPGDSIISLAWDLQGNGQFKDGNDTVNKYLFTAGGYHPVGMKVITKNNFVKAEYKLVPVNYVHAAFTYKSNCVNDPVQFTNGSTMTGGEQFSFLWKFGDGTSPSALKNPVHKYSDTGTYVVSLHLASAAGCSDSARQNVHISGAPAVSLDFSRDTIMTQRDTLFVSVIGTYDSIRWSTNSTTSTILIANSPGYYWVKAYKGSCYGEKGFNVVVTEPSNAPLVSNLFTPNGDGINDYWEILNLADFAPCKVNVYNRYGIQVYSSDDYHNDWDGLFNGKRLANDSYVYYVKCFDQVQYKGTVNILR